MALVFMLKVVPQSGKSAFQLDKTGALKCYVVSPAEDGKANKEVLKSLAKSLNIAQQDIEIVQGLTTRTKRIKIHKAWTLQDLYTALGLAYQPSLITGA